MPCLLYVVRQALAQLFFFRVSFAFLLSFFLSSFLSFFLSFCLGGAAELWAFLFRSFSRAATRARQTSRLRRGRVVRLEFSRFSCAPAGRCSLFPLVVFGAFSCFFPSVPLPFFCAPPAAASCWLAALTTGQFLPRAEPRPFSLHQGAFSAPFFRPAPRPTRTKPVGSQGMSDPS